MFYRVLAWLESFTFTPMYPLVPTTISFGKEPSLVPSHDLLLERRRVYAAVVIVNDVRPQVASNGTSECYHTIVTNLE